MKTNHESLLRAISEAISLCSYDSVLSPAKSHLQSAILIVENVAKKRGRREKDRVFFEEQAKKKQGEWWNLLKQNLTIPEEKPK